jgi:hypothetical protein
LSRIVVIERLLDGQRTYEVSTVDYPAGGYGNNVDKFSECAALTIGVLGRLLRTLSNRRSENHLPSLSCAP